ncbi:YjcZ family sporulation protein [Bacillus sp. DJP31]
MMNYGYDQCHTGYGYGQQTGGYNNSFALIVVLFILLIIIGASYVN